ncbi:MAG: hypothetical protein U1E51_27250 [Candidatus Binatia bacterium]|nr:hypothetical protein [Candidatus Binatia bacterium]
MTRNAKIVCPSYLAWVKSQYCLIGFDCLGPMDPHHLIAVQYQESKRNDFTAVNLCRKHHSEVETISVADFELRYEVNLWKEAALNASVFFADPERRAKVKIDVER